MKDAYPSLPREIVDRLVPSNAQPDYAPIDDIRVSPFANVGAYLSDRQVDLGRGAQVAVIGADTGTSYSFSQLAEESSRLAAALLRLGVKPGDRIAYRTPNVPEALTILCGIWKSGAIVVPVPMQATTKDIRYYFEDTLPRFFFAHARSGDDALIEEATAGTSVEETFVFGHGAGTRRRAEHLARVESAATLPPVPCDSIAILWHTGGTTGRPKGCYHTHRRFLYGGYTLGDALKVSPGERWAAAAPIGHALGIIYNTIFTLLHGATAVLVEKFHDPAALLQAASQRQLTTLTALSASWGKMLEVIDANPSLDLHSIKRAFAMWQSASSSDVYDRWKAKGIELLNNFGSTSFATWVIVPSPGSVSPRAALGRAAPGFEVAAIERVAGVIRPVAAGECGQLAVRGPTGLTYWNRPELQAKDVVDGWTLSDDLISFDADANIHYLGRTDFMISTGGFKVAPGEVENVLSRHPAVREVCVVPGPCPIHREMVVAYVVLETGYSGSDTLAKTLRDFAKTELVAYKCPRRIEFISALPRDAVGKVQNRVVKAWAEERKPV